MGKQQELSHARNTKKNIDGVIVDLNYEVCKESYSSTHCDKQKRKKYGQLAHLLFVL